MGRRPELKSEEFSFVDNPFTRYRGVKTYSQQNKCYTFSELYPTVPPAALPPLVTATELHTTTHTRAGANSCCPSVEPHPFRSKEHSTASGPPDEGTLATAVPGSSDPTLIRGEGALLTWRPTRHAGSDGPTPLVTLRCT